MAPIAALLNSSLTQLRCMVPLLFFGDILRLPRFKRISWLARVNLAKTGTELIGVEGALWLRKLDFQLVLRLARDDHLMLEHATRAEQICIVAPSSDFPSILPPHSYDFAHASDEAELSSEVMQLNPEYYPQRYVALRFGRAQRPHQTSGLRAVPAANVEHLGFATQQSHFERIAWLVRIAGTPEPFRQLASSIEGMVWRRRSDGKLVFRTNDGHYLLEPATKDEQISVSALTENLPGLRNETTRSAFSAKTDKEISPFLASDPGYIPERLVSVCAGRNRHYPADLTLATNSEIRQAVRPRRVQKL